MENNPRASNVVDAGDDAHPRPTRKSFRARPEKREVSVQDSESENMPVEPIPEDKEVEAVSAETIEASREEPSEAVSEPREPDELTEHHVDPASILIDRIGGMIFFLIVGGGLFFGMTLFWILGKLPSWLYLPLLLPLVGLTFLSWQWPVMRYRHIRYRVDARGFQIWRGVLWRKVISIPTTRVQHTDVTQGPIQRYWDLATLTVHTAGTEGASISLSGLRLEVAKRLRDHLLPDSDHAV